MTARWKDTSLVITMQNDKKYKGGYKSRTMSNAIENPTEDQVNAIGTALDSLSDDSFESGLIVKRTTVFNDK